MDSLTDNALMLMVKEGNLDKMGLLFERYKQQLFGYFYNMGHSPDSGEDLVQNVFVRMLRYKHTFRGEGEFRTWMFHIARNVNADFYKKQKRSAMQPLEDWMEELAEGHLYNESEIELLKKAINKLDNEKREVLVLCKLDEMKYKCAAEILGCSEGAVKVKVFRALKELKKVYHQMQNQ